MLFNSFEFLVFFVVVTVLYYLLPHRYRWLLLLLASCGFYMAFIPVYILILLLTIGIDYVAGIQIEQAAGRRRKQFLVLSLVANLGVLAFFKYYNFFTDNINALLDGLHVVRYELPYLYIILPIGLSFHTFQAMSYTIEVYRGNYPAERHLGIYALYVMFYPQLVAGPIERPQNVLPQFHEEKHFNFDQVVIGLQRMLWGLFKKVVIGDVLAEYVNSVYNNYEMHSSLSLWLATYAFAGQIYCDFSGYSDMALGSAQVMGFKLMENFRMPYFAKSVTEFWRRWHMSLSTWLRDYLYVSLGGSRLGQLLTYRNLLLTMLLGGLWHGASWNFVIWGGLNGLYLSTEKLLGVQVDRPMSWAGRVGRVALTFHLICLTWVFFRATTLEQALYITRHLIEPVREVALTTDWGMVATFGVRVGLLLLVEFAWLRRHRFQELSPAYGWGRPLAVALTLTLLILTFGVATGDQFIYFQF
ncbi:MBOAT family O-acyltransferase [Hymenobacter rubripertinctus]|uniref:MBOAT family protein n=1 Tax=Hymenobacter rubripertinctus TaxID=2029981 RepID=A0A418R8W5_9BACT|nr:MBOAT family O-acyltransferase [Hymenobacter rubripertinctus]RIY13725.1 MBOAT family protein [Hymenobacter rubripertinctus]